jgi:hypothetical protein
MLDVGDGRPFIGNAAAIVESGPHFSLTAAPARPRAEGRGPRAEGRGPRAERFFDPDRFGSFCSINAAVGVVAR